MKRYTFDNRNLKNYVSKKTLEKYDISEYKISKRPQRKFKVITDNHKLDKYSMDIITENKSKYL